MPSGLRFDGTVGLAQAGRTRIFFTLVADQAVVDLKQSVPHRAAVVGQLKTVALPQIPRPHPALCCEVPARDGSDGRDFDNREGAAS